MAQCTAKIDLARPIRSERVRAGFQPHWRTVFIYRCLSCGEEHRAFASRFIGRNATPEIGAIVCGRTLTVEGAYRRAARVGLVTEPESLDVERAMACYARNVAEPGDVGRDNDAILLGLAIAEAHVGHNPGWIPESQRIGVEIAKIL